ncbi:META domain-containing protein [Ilumatobacter nonamiensis]|uniref:META domain-containing protein n=1 Tax=Ilumatobacter nonamiensis TaxID=467093 RepID=UPI00034655A8|nr:META domain-containing protein [Ilumatobacter nonamiensis]
MNRLLLLPILLLSIAACGSDPDDSSGAGDDVIEITGNLTYLPRIALVPGGTATVTLEDVSVADTAAPVIAEQTIELDDQQIPIPFALSVDPADLESSGMYSVRAEITGADGSLNWTTDTANIVEADGGSVDLGDLVLIQVSPSEADGDATPLSGEWTVTEIDGTPVVEETAATLVFGDDGTLAGTTGCNSYTTDVEIDGDQLVLGEIAVTLMACLGEVATQEAAFLAILNDSPTFELIATNLQLMIESASGSTLSASR